MRNSPNAGPLVACVKRSLWRPRANTPSLLGLLWGLLGGCAGFHVSRGSADLLQAPTADFLEPTIRAADIWDAQEREEGYRARVTIPYSWVKATAKVATASALVAASSGCSLWPWRPDYSLTERKVEEVSQDWDLWQENLEEGGAVFDEATSKLRKPEIPGTHSNDPDYGPGDAGL